MRNQNRQDFENHLAAEVSPAQRVYSFKDLPTNVQHVVVYLDAFALPVPDDSALPVVFTEDMLRKGES